MKTSWPRSNMAQVVRMAKRWPQFEVVQHTKDLVAWRGIIRGGQKEYLIGIVWALNSGIVPLVRLLDPLLEPREGGSFDEIPHLIFNNTRPEESHLCLFDGKSKDWDRTQMIADTIVPWAARWLLYYEMWQHDGIWRGGGVGYESTAAARAALVH